MNASRVESVLAILYFWSVVLSLVSIVSLAIPWNHWRWSLDICLNMDCGCILYGVTTFSTFMGGDVKVCTFGVYALVPVVFLALFFAAYHGYRSCVYSHYRDQSAIQTTYYNKARSGGEMVIVTPKARPPFKQWTSTAFLAIIIFCLCLSHAIVITDGYYKTCQQYKRNMVKLLNAPSRVADMIHNRIDCAAVLDYMDYLQPDENNWIRRERINTKVALHLTIVSTWFNVFSWTAIFITNIIMAKRVNNFGKKLCCCPKN